MFINRYIMFINGTQCVFATRIGGICAITTHITFNTPVPYAYCFNTPIFF